MKKVFYMLSLFMLALITSCTTDSLDSGVNLDIETTKLDIIFLLWGKIHGNHMELLD